MNHKVAVEDWQKLGFSGESISKRVESIADELALVSVKQMDALHVACTIEVEAKYFLTTV